MTYTVVVWQAASGCDPVELYREICAIAGRRSDAWSGEIGDRVSAFAAWLAAVHPDLADQMTRVVVPDSEGRPIAVEVDLPMVVSDDLLDEISTTAADFGLHYLDPQHLPDGAVDDDELVAQLSPEDERELHFRTDRELRMTPDAFAALLARYGLVASDGEHPEDGRSGAGRDVASTDHDGPRRTGSGRARRSHE